MCLYPCRDKANILKGPEGNRFHERRRCTADRFLQNRYSRAKLNNFKLDVQESVFDDTGTVGVVSARSRAFGCQEENKRHDQTQSIKGVFV